MNKPKVSVLLSNYNGEKFVAEAIESILKQTYRDFELIVIDDGSKDGSVAIIQQLVAKDPRIVFIQNEENLSLPVALNIGLQRARGEYVVRMDSDDVASPQRIETLVAFMENPQHENIAVCGSYCELIDESGKVIGIKKFPRQDKDIRSALWYRNPIQHSTAIIRKRCLDDLGGYNVTFPQSQDYELWFRIGQKYQLHNLEEVLMRYRVHGENAIIQKQKNMIQLALRARKMAVHDYGYTISLRAQIFNSFTRLALILPIRLVYWMFRVMQQNKEQV